MRPLKFRSPDFFSALSIGLAIMALQGCRSAAPPEKPAEIAKSQCGNGAVENGESCDDGNTQGGDGCSADCQSEALPTACGNAVLENGEGCDDGNTQGGDGCSADCQQENISACGNGILDPGEVCDDANAIADDGCEADCTKTQPKEIVCGPVQPIAQGVCEVTPGGPAKIITGTVLTPGTIYRGGQVALNAQGLITCVGCDCKAQAQDATQILCPSGVISPGLINTHDHITYAHNTPPADTGERYEHRHDWRRGINCHNAIGYEGSATDDEIRWGELRFVLGGATSTVGAGGIPGLLRNLDTIDQEGLAKPEVKLSTFPLGDSNGTQQSAGCGYPSITSANSIAGVNSFIAHVSEGIDAYSRNEFLCLSRADSGGEDLLEPQSAFIHGVSLNPKDFAEMAGSGTDLIWSPRSNISLYGHTADVLTASRLGVNISLGTDWVSSGSINMLRELQCADFLNENYYSGFFTNEELWNMATLHAAQASGVSDVLGELAVGKLGDISIWNGSVHSDHRAIIDAGVGDVVLVMRAGKALYGDTALIDGLVPGGACEPASICGIDKKLCISDEIGISYGTLQSNVGTIYPAYFCDTPVNEPTCVPSRTVPLAKTTTFNGIATPSDTDGDGIDNNSDICPTVFDPIRPVDKGVQADYDHDGIGDACDACPLQAGAAPCKPWNEADGDGDAIENVIDNCPDIANTDQMDGDGDGRGDACDACAAQANTNGVPCNTTIYDIKNGKIPTGTYVSINNALVAATGPTGYYLQVKAGDPGDLGPSYSGIFVYQTNPIVKAGDRVDISGAWVDEYFGQIQLSKAQFTFKNTPSESIDALPVQPDEIATCAPKAREFDGVLVSVANPSVSDIPSPDKEFEINSTLIIDDLLYTANPFPKAGDPFAKLSGVASFSSRRSVLLPRGPWDFQGALKSFGPPQSFVYTGMLSGSSIPQALSVELSYPVPTDTFIDITSSAPNSLSVLGDGVLIPAGGTSAVVDLSSGLVPLQNATLTATWNNVSYSADVRVLDPAEQPVLQAIGPDPAFIATGKTQDFAVKLDIPAPADLSVDLVLEGGAQSSVPASVLVPKGQTDGIFSFTAGGTKQLETLTATLNGKSVSLPVSITGRLVINEVDYDQPSTDAAEFIELFNDTGSPIDLLGYELILINGSSNLDYGIVDLSPAGILEPGAFVLICWNDMLAAQAPAGTLVLKPGTGSGKIQNGDALPDGIALVHLPSAALIDAISYKGSLTAAQIPGWASPVSLVETAPTPLLDSGSVPASLCRIPDGHDQDNASIDWILSNAPTPGAANKP